jgi:hypothetical protein
MCEAAQPDSCAIDHAHLHVMPFDDSALLTRFRNDHTCREIWSPHELNRTLVRDSEYLLLIDNRGIGHIALPNRAPGQYFRKAISEIIGRELWNWHDEVILNDRSEARVLIQQTRALFRRA